MESLSFESITTSKPFLFKVGPDKREFFMHSALVASLSRPLDRLVNGWFVEALGGSVSWPSVDEATFILFSRFAYTGDYSITAKSFERESQNDKRQLRAPKKATGDAELPPRPRTKNLAQKNVLPDALAASGASKTSSDQATDMSLPVRLPASYLVIQDAASPPPSRSQQAVRVAFLQAFLDKEPPRPPTSGTSPPFWSRAPTALHVHGGILLAHAKVYVLADCYQIDDLAAKVLRNLYDQLLRCSCRMSDVLCLVEYLTTTPVPATLRELVLVYIVGHARFLWRNIDFQKLLMSDGSLVSDLLETTSKVMGA